MRFVYLLTETVVDYDYSENRVLGICTGMDEAIAAADEWSDDGKRDIDIYEVPLGHFIDGDFLGPWYTHPDNDRVEYLDEERYESEQAEWREKLALKYGGKPQPKRNPLRGAGKAQGWPYTTFGQNVRAGQ